MLMMRAPGPGLGPLMLMMRALWGLPMATPKLRKQTRNWVGSAALAVAPFAKAKQHGYRSEARISKAHALGDRALPDLGAAPPPPYRHYIRDNMHADCVEQARSFTRVHVVTTDDHSANQPYGRTSVDRRRTE